MTEGDIPLRHVMERSGGITNLYQGKYKKRLEDT